MKIRYAATLTLFVVLLSVTLPQLNVSGVARGTAGIAGAPRWLCWGPGLPDPCRNRLNDVAVTPGSGGNDVWVVGDRGTILHWDGSVWTKIPSHTAAHLFGIAMASASRGWATGSDGALLEWNGATWIVLPPKSADWYRAIALVPNVQPVQAWAPGDRAGVGSFLHYNGAEWQSKIGDYTPLFGGTLFDVSMVSVADGWAVGNKFGGTGMVGQVLRWDGARWNTFSNPADELYGLHMLSASDGWSVGEAGAAYRWSGAGWSKIATPRNAFLNDVHMVAANDGWAVGVAGALFRWNGVAWTDHTASSIAQDLRGVAMTSAADGWAVGDGGVILRWNGSAWRTVVAPSHTRLDSLAMTPGLGGGDGWAVGEGRNLLHWDGNGWTPVTGPASSYYAAAMVSQQDGWAAGPGGRFYRFNGVSWAEAARVKSALDLVMLSASDGWAVGWGTLQHWDGAAWSEVSSPTSRTLYGADALAPNEIWAAGDGGTIVRYTGGSWQSVPAPDTTWLTDVSMASSQLGYIVGNFGTILRWNGASWTKIANSPTSMTLRGVAVTRGAGQPTGWAVGYDGAILRLQDGTWQALTGPTGNDLFDVVIVSATEAWAVGEHGVILRYTDAPEPPIATATPTPTGSPALKIRLYLPLIVR